MGKRPEKLMETKIAFVGDIMPGGVLHGKPSGVSLEIKSYLKSFDFRVGTLECAIGDEPTFDPVKMSLKQDVIYAPNINLDKLVELGINCVSLANNHVIDLGEEGLKNTICQLDKLGILHVGAGSNFEEASKPVIINNEDHKIGFIGLCDFREETVGYVPIATSNSPGVNSLSNDYVEQIKKLKKKVDYLYIIVHWGNEHTFWPDIQMLDTAKRCIDAGATGIIGGHQHRIQPLVYYHNIPIFLGLGNFLFPPRYLRPPRPMYYPKPNEDTSKFPITDVYPWVKVPTYKIWKRLGRIGAIGSICITSDYSFHAHMKFVEMKDNKLSFIHHPLNFLEHLEYLFVKRSILNSGNDQLFKVSKMFNRITKGILRRIRKIFNNHN